MSNNRMPGSGGPNLPLSSSYNLPWLFLYYYNRRTRISTWEKPRELMTEMEGQRANTSTNLREFTSPEGRKCHDKNFGSISVVKTSSPGADGSLVSAHGAKSSPIAVSPAANLPTIVASESSSLSGKVSSPMIETVEMKNSSEPTSPAVANSEKIGIAVTLGNSVAPPVSETTTTQDAVVYGDGFSSENRENVKKDAAITEIGGATPSDEKTVELGPLVYESKAAMRAVINDRRYGALKSLCERKQAFNEYLSQKKKLEAEERRVKQKKAREDFRIMLEDCKELSPSSRWRQSPYSNMMNVLKLLSELKTSEDLFEDYVEELEKKVKLLLQNFLEHVKALEEQKRNRVEYLSFDFIKASSQWRKVQDRLETDERCSRLEKIDRLEIFQEYIRDLESEEEEQRKLRMEELRKAERKNRDEFRKLMEEHVAAGILNAKTNWRDYCIKDQQQKTYLQMLWMSWRNR
ncbi:hypothetical protein P3S68_010735 [Capsicum galapagoense]